MFDKVLNIQKALLIFNRLRFVNALLKGGNFKTFMVTEK